MTANAQKTNAHRCGIVKGLSPHSWHSMVHVVAAFN